MNNGLPQSQPEHAHAGPPALYSVEELAEAWKISKSTIRKWIRNGRLKPVRLCRRVLISQEEAQRFYRENQ